MGLSIGDLGKLAELIGPAPTTLKNPSTTMGKRSSASSTPARPGKKGAEMPVFDEVDATLDEEELPEETLPVSGLERLLAAHSKVIEGLVKKRDKKDVFADLFGEEKASGSDSSAVKGVGMRRELKKIFQ